MKDRRINLWILPLLLGTLGLPRGQAQPTNTPAGPALTAPAAGSAVRPATPVKPAVGGAIAAVVRSPQPLQMLNPAAPREFGDGTQFLARDPLTHEAQGVTLLSFSFGGPPSAKKAKPPKPAKTKPTKAVSPASPLPVAPLPR